MCSVSKKKTHTHTTERHEVGILLRISLNFCTPPKSYFFTTILNVMNLIWCINKRFVSSNVQIWQFDISLMQSISFPTLINLRVCIWPLNHSEYPQPDVYCIIYIGIMNFISYWNSTIAWRDSDFIKISSSFEDYNEKCAQSEPLSY